MAIHGSQGDRHVPESTNAEAPEPRHGWCDVLRQRDRLWLLLIILIIAAFFLGGCHARGGGHVHVSSCGSSSADSALAVFYVVYLLGWSNSRWRTVSTAVIKLFKCAAKETAAVPPIGHSTTETEPLHGI